MDDETDFAADGFVFSYPLWVPVNRDNPDVLYCAGPLTKAHRFVGVFTDEDLADRFLAATAPEEGVKRPIGNVGEMLIFLGGAVQIGTTHVFFDPPPKPGVARNVTTVGHLVEVIGRQLAPPPDEA